MTLKRFRWIKQEPIGVMRLEDIRKKLLADPHHFGIKIPDPVHLNGFILEITFSAHLIILHDHGTFDTFSLMLRYYSED